MAKSKTTSKSKLKEPPIEDKSLWYSDLSSMDPAFKNSLWASMALLWMKRGTASVLFLDPAKAKIYRDTDQLKLDERVYKQMVDPVTPLDTTGGKAEYFSSDWKANPIYIHLKNIVKAEIEKTGKQLEASFTDKFAKTRRMNENYRLLYKDAFRNFINQMSEALGLPKISDNQDPYKWAKNLNLEKTDSKDRTKESDDVISKYSDLIRNQITDSQDLALYNEMIYKCDYEAAIEMGIRYYIMNLNKWQERWADEFIDDLMHFNKACGEWYTDLITGRPVIERFVPERLWTSPFVRKDGEDIMYYWTEYSISFGDFTRQVGRNLSPKQLKEVFELAKIQGCHGVSWQDNFYQFGTSNYSRDNATIRIGKAAFLSQDLSVEIEDTTNGYPLYQDAPLTWFPMEGDPYKKRIEKNYNVWRWWYYIPPTLDTINNANYEWQSHFIFELQKYQDQFRYGDAGRYSKSPLVIYDNSSQATFTDITQAYMPKIHHTWHKFQNYMVNGFEATIFSDDFLGGLLSAVDEDNKINYGDPDVATGGNGKDAFMQQWRQIKQGMKGFLKMSDKNGQPLLDPSKLVLQIDDKHMEKAEKALMIMLMQYDLMIKSLALSPMTAGEEVKPRTPVAALEQSLKASDSATFFIQKAYEAFLCMYGERITRYIFLIMQEAKDGYSKRFDEFMDNVGYANGLAIEGMDDIDPECVGLTISYVDTQKNREFVMSLAMEYVKTKELSEDFLYLIMGCDNWKYAFVLMRLAIKQRKKEIKEEQALQQQYLMEQKNADLQFAMALQGAKDAGKDQNIVTEGKIEMMINDALNKNKAQTMLAVGEQRRQAKEVENQQKSDLQKTDKSHEANLKAQEAILPV